ncbi:GMP synthase-like glutamine amidotransferase [Geodermatophilus tzadiensis]|uniref:GMP synthase-like glutamine amidotransferase n=1 Tax=Geodermatophilus tzadiensis TaxID=1137988 RepID=A0A2T0TSL6_9ACTN|nr:type 1 glutamine amidotransferase [Geodermatophilus tzadiensis]PRY48651.1 GMP synthase-like glutamine amidotransferase [Geodermatophilus tzadiensis]
MRSALVLVHDADPSRGHRLVGTLRPALEAQGLDVVVGTTVGPSPLLTDLPDPATLDTLVVMGSGAAAYDDTVPWLATELAYLRRAVDAGTPVLGVCFGGQALSRVLGGVVSAAPAGEHGFLPVETADPELVPAGLWFEYHGDRFTVPPGGVEVARTQRAVQAFAYGPHLGVQFHPEIDPGVFSAWEETWELTGPPPPGAAALVPGLRAEIAARREVSAAACARLVAAFLARADGLAGGRAA